LDDAKKPPTASNFFKRSWEVDMFAQEGAFEQISAAVLHYDYPEVDSHS